MILKALWMCLFGASEFRSWRTADASDGKAMTLFGSWDDRANWAGRWGRVVAVLGWSKEGREDGLRGVRVREGKTTKIVGVVLDVIDRCGVVAVAVSNCRPSLFVICGKAFWCWFSVDLKHTPVCKRKAPTCSSTRDRWIHNYCFVSPHPRPSAYAQLVRPNSLPPYHNHKPEFLFSYCVAPGWWELRTCGIEVRVWSNHSVEVMPLHGHKSKIFVFGVEEFVRTIYAGVQFNWMEVLQATTTMARRLAVL